MESLRISPQEVDALLQKRETVVFVDSRDPKAWAKADSKLPGAIRVLADEVESHVTAIPKDATVVAYCT